MTTTYGYARVSTEAQDLEPQLAALRAAGCMALVEEKASGADRDWPELRHLLERLRRGDTVVVVRIDRLARSLAHLLEVLDRMLGESHAENVRPIRESGVSSPLRR
jgi:DNA invertase Pin-like site-specific DNA recombinase